MKMPVNHKPLTKEEIGKKEYCKWHNVTNHSTVNCLAFLNVIQDHIDDGLLRFPDEKKADMKIDNDPFPANLAELSVNMVELGSGRLLVNREFPGNKRNRAQRSPPREVDRPQRRVTCPRCSSSGSGGEAYVSVFDVPLDSRVKPRKLTPRRGGISKGTSSGR